MKSTVLLVFVCSEGFWVAGQQMNVSICNLDDIRETIVASAKNEAELVFRSAGVQIAWKDCGEFPSPDAQKHEPRFVIRLRAGNPSRTVGPASLDLMGKAFVVARGEGYMADGYLEAIQWFAGRYQGDSGALLGFVMAHELGHLLLGPGHAPDGVMCAAWRQTEISALRQRWLKFNPDCAACIRRELLARYCSLPRPSTLHTSSTAWPRIP